MTNFVGMPIDLICYRLDRLKVFMRRRFESGDACFTALGRQWSKGSREVFRRLPDLEWQIQDVCR